MFEQLSLNELQFLARPSQEDLQEAFVDSLALMHDVLCVYGYEREGKRFTDDEYFENFLEVERSFNMQLADNDKSSAISIYSKIENNRNLAEVLAGQARESSESNLIADNAAEFQNALLWAYQVVNHFASDTVDFVEPE